MSTGKAKFSNFSLRKRRNYSYYNTFKEVFVMYRLVNGKSQI
nr:MAG TPA: hypothetical protein [Caudoviricetes sp.]